MCSSPKGSNPATYSSIPESNYHNTVSHLLDVDDELILEQLDHYVNELSSDWKGKLMFPCHVIYDLGDATFSKVNTVPPLINICDYIGWQAFQCKRLYFSPINYPPTQTQNEMSLSFLTNLCKGWTRLCRDLLVAGLEHGNTLVCNGSQKSNTNNRVFKCGVLYRSMRPSRAMEVSDKNPLWDTTLINNRKNNQEDGIHGPKRIKTIDQRYCTCSFKFILKWQIQIDFFIELEKYAGESFHCFHPKVLDTSTIPFPS